MATTNLFDVDHGQLDSEIIEEIIAADSVRIERILSRGQASPTNDWYDQDENEWVVVLKGHGRLLFDDGTKRDLSAGDCVNIPAHRRHRVAWTDPDQPTIWLAVFYR